MVEISDESVIVNEGWVMGADYLCGVWGNQKIPTGVIWIYRCTTKGVGQPPQILIADATNDVRKGAQELRQLDDEYHAPGVYKFENYMCVDACLHGDACGPCEGSEIESILLCFDPHEVGHIIQLLNNLHRFLLDPIDWWAIHLSN